MAILCRILSWAATNLQRPPILGLKVTTLVRFHCTAYTLVHAHMYIYMYYPLVHVLCTVGLHVYISQVGIYIHAHVCVSQCIA